MAEQDTAVQVSAGVEKLIERLREEGVANGRAKADQIVEEAEARASELLAQAQQKADQILTQARQEANKLQQAGEEALKVAARDAMLTLKNRLTQRFTGKIQRLVTEELEKQELLEKLILEVAGRVSEQVVESKQVEILLPRRVMGLEELSTNPEELRRGALTHFVRLIGQGMLREGVSFGVSQDEVGGLQLRLVDQEVVLDLTDKAIAGIILQNLQPRFRALLEGMVR